MPVKTDKKDAHGIAQLVSTGVVHLLALTVTSGEERPRARRTLARIEKARRRSPVPQDHSQVYDLRRRILLPGSAVLAFALGVRTALESSFATSSSAAPGSQPPIP